MLWELWLKMMPLSRDPSNQMALNSVWGCKHFSFLGHFRINSSEALFLRPTVLDCPSASSIFIQTTFRTRGYSTITAQRPQNGETLLPEQHICGFVIFKVSKKTFQTAFEPWCLTIVCPNWSPACTHTFAFTTLVLFFLPLSFQLPYF